MGDPPKEEMTLSKSGRAIDAQRGLIPVEKSQAVNFVSSWGLSM